MDAVKEIHPGANIIYINKELHEFVQIADWQDLFSDVKTKCTGFEKSYLFIDEVQEIREFERALRGLLAEGLCDIYCTGSNAELLSGEIATMLAGRALEFRIHGMSYQEFLEFHNLSDSEEALQKYMRYGGLPYLIHIELSDNVIFEYLGNIYSTILFKDVVARHNIRNVHFLERLTQYLAINTGNLMSAKKISDYLKNQNIRLSLPLVLKYLSFLTATFFVSRVPRAEIGRKKVFEIGEKYYFEDLGPRHAIIGFHQKDINRILENLVFLHLRLSGFNVFVGKIGQKEIDFVAERNEEKMYVQVAYLIPDDTVRYREFGNLLEIRDNYPKIVVSMDPIRTPERGIEHLHVREFLLRTFQ
ncbi:hypothetical protein ES703_59327 [subsurface metagenome]